MDGISELDNYKLLQEIGKGSASTVYEVKEKSIVTKTTWAMKAVDLKFKSEDDVHSVLQEVRILALLHKHPSIPKLHDSFISRSHLG
jgi:serine/threonine protein kinase